MKFNDLKISVKQTGILSKIYENPTGNCQSCSISYINEILSYFEDRGIQKVIKDLKDIAKNTKKRLFLIDVNLKYKETIETIFKEEAILVNSPYKNTYHQHDMILYLLDKMYLVNYDENGNEIKKVNN